MVFEVGKNWAEADADVAETIDFAEFYAREALRLAQAKTPTQLPGEADRLIYIPLGVAAVIPPWNFPCAIMAGMTMAAIVTGNTVVLKPSHDSPAIAAKFFEALQEAGMPDGVANFCPGTGTGFGRGLVAHPQTRFIAFTGSKEVGLDVNQRAAITQPGQKWIKRTILEMGGKDSIIVDADANLDAAVEGVAQAAFGFQGQKCSACSRAIVDEKIYDVFLERLKDRVSKITVGDPTENQPMGPVVSEKAMKSILNYIEIGKKEGRLIHGGGPAKEAGDGYFIQPTVIADIKTPPNTQLGDPLSKLMTTSNGVGVGGGIGSGSGGGVGSGHGGPGVGPGIFHVGDGVSAPRPIFTPEPEFSEEARKAKYQGVVVLNIVVGTDGRVHNPRVVRSLGMGLDEKAIEGVKTWKFDPSKKDGRNVAVEMNIEVAFNLY